MIPVQPLNRHVHMSIITQMQTAAHVMSSHVSGWTSLCKGITCPRVGDLEGEMNIDYRIIRWNTIWTKISHSNISFSTVHIPILIRHTNMDVNMVSVFPSKMFFYPHLYSNSTIQFMYYSLQHV